MTSIKSHQVVKEKAPLLVPSDGIGLNFLYVFRLWASIGVFHLETHLVPLSKSLESFMVMEEK